MTFFEELQKRGLVDNISHEELIEKINAGGLSFYVGFDPTSPSLQIGNLLVLCTMLRFKNAGHNPIPLIGGATGMIGDPSGKNSERNLLDEETLKNNVLSQEKQIRHILNLKKEDKVLNNYDWFSSLSFLEVLRDIGKNFKLSEMVAKDSVKSRLSSESGISYTEFSYQVLQGYDFAYLEKNHGVSLQVGGSDQWGNMTAGISLTKKMNNKQVHCLTIPLIKDAQGNKFGKSEGKSLYLDKEMTSPYKMYQYFINCDDQSVIAYLKLFSFKSLDEITEIEKATLAEPHKRIAQKALAEEVVLLVHGKEGLESAQKATDILFGKEIKDISERDLLQIFEDVATITLNKDKKEFSLVEDLSQIPLFKGKGDVRRSIEQGGVYINNKKVSLETKISKEDFFGDSLVFRKGKKNYVILKILAKDKTNG